MSLGRLRRNTCIITGVRFNSKFVNQMRQHKLCDVIFMVITITFLVVLDVLTIFNFIYCCITRQYNINEIIFWAIVIPIVFGAFNFFCITMIKDINNK